MRAAELPCPPEPPNGAQPYARIVLPEAIRLVALDNQTFDSRLRIKEIQVTPGFHTLRFVYAGNSPQHAGQQNDPFNLKSRRDTSTSLRPGREGSSGDRWSQPIP